MTPAQLAETIRALRARRGRAADTLALDALTLLADVAAVAPARDRAELKFQLGHVAAQLPAVRPSMASIGVVVDAWRECLDGADGGDIASLRDGAIAASLRLRDTAMAARRAATARLSSRLRSVRQALTLGCDTLVERALVALPDRSLRVICAEGRPMNEGRFLAESLSRAGFVTELITDAQSGLAMGMVDTVVVGADTVLADGTIISKSGTYPLACVAAHAGVPLVAAYEAYKRLPDDAMPPPLEYFDTAEFGYPIPAGVNGRNAYCDVTPAALITDHCTDDAPIKQPLSGRR